VPFGDKPIVVDNQFVFEVSRKMHPLIRARFETLVRVFNTNERSSWTSRYSPFSASTIPTALGFETCSKRCYWADSSELQKRPIDRRLSEGQRRRRQSVWGEVFSGRLVKVDGSFWYHARFRGARCPPPAYTSGHRHWHREGHGTIGYEGVTDLMNAVEELTEDEDRRN
jgi:hypothetical protein